MSSSAKIDLRNPIFHDDNAAREYSKRLLYRQPETAVPRLSALAEAKTRF